MVADLQQTKYDNQACWTSEAGMKTPTNAKRLLAQRRSNDCVFAVVSDWCKSPVEHLLDWAGNKTNHFKCKALCQSIINEVGKAIRELCVDLDWWISFKKKT